MSSSEPAVDAYHVADKLVFPPRRVNFWHQAWDLSTFPLPMLLANCSRSSLRPRQLQTPLARSTRGRVTG